MSILIAMAMLMSPRQQGAMKRREIIEGVKTQIQSHRLYKRIEVTPVNSLLYPAFIPYLKAVNYFITFLLFHKPVDKNKIYIYENE